MSKTLALCSDELTVESVLSTQFPGPNFLCLRFEVQGVKSGFSLGLVGNSAILGMWDLDHRVHLSLRTGSSLWISDEVVIPVQESHISLEYKYVLITSVFTI